MLRQTLPRNRLGPYQLQAAISAVHAQSPAWEETDWAQIHALYALLYQMKPSPVIRLNQSLALSHCRSPQEGLEMLQQAVADNSELDAYQPYYAARADLLARCDRTREAAESYQKAIELSDNHSERQFLQLKLDRLEGQGDSA